MSIKYILAAALLLISTPIIAQQSQWLWWGSDSNHLVPVTASNPLPVTGAGGGGSPGGSTNDIQYKSGASTFGGITLTDGQSVVGQTGATPLAKTMSGDCTRAASGAVTCLTLNGLTPGAFFNLAFPAATDVLGSDGATFTSLTLGTGLGLNGTTIVPKLVINAQSGATYTILTTDANKIVEMTNASPTTVTMLSGATAGVNFGTSVACDAGCTINRAGSDTFLVNGASTTSLTLAAGQSVDLVGDGASPTIWRQWLSATRDPSNATNLISGTVAAARLPNPSSSTLGGIESFAAQSNKWINTISTSGVPSATQPAFTDISGTATVAQGGTGQTSYTDGQLLIGNTTGNTIDKATLTAGTNVTITNGHGTITIAASGGGVGCTTSGSSGQILLDNGLGGCTSDASATLSTGALALGASGTAGSVALGNATSGTVTLQPVTGALGTVTASLPANTGTIAELNLAQTWSAAQSFNSSDLLLKGATSGTITLNAAAAAGSNTLTLPAGTTDFSGTGGTSQVVKQTSSGGAFTVARLACSDLSDSGAGCTGSAGGTNAVSAVSTSQLDKTSDTVLADITGMTSMVLLASKTYACHGTFFGVAAASGGLKIALVNADTLTTSTGTRYQYTHATAGTGQATATFGNAVGVANAITSGQAVFLDATIVVNAGGTMKVQAAQQTSNGTASSVFVGSNLSCVQTN